MRVVQKSNLIIQPKAAPRFAQRNQEILLNSLRAVEIKVIDANFFLVMYEKKSGRIAA